MQMYYRLLSLIVLATLIAGCPEPAEPLRPVEGTHLIMPLKVGNRWIGTWTLHNDDGSIILAIPDTLTIIAEEKVGDETGFQGSDGAFYLNRADGLWVRSGETGDSLVLQAKYPAAVGETFSAEQVTTLLPEGPAGPTDVTIAMAVLDTARRVSTEAGIYRCYLYQPRILDHPDISLAGRLRRKYYAPDVGPVRIDWPDGSQRWELVSATIR